jgi:hypothetical protein
MLRRLIMSWVGILACVSITSKTHAQAASTFQPAVTIAFSTPDTNSSAATVLLHLSDFPKNEEIFCMIKRPVFNHAEDFLGKFRVNDQGKILGQDNQEKEALELPIQGFLPGEEITALFHTKEGRLLASTSFIPYILRQANPDNSLVLSAELTGMDHYRLFIEGLEEGEKFNFQSVSEDEVLKDEITYHSGNGLAIAPAVLERFGGVAVVSITAKGKAVSLKLPWGITLLSYKKTGK